MDSQVSFSPGIQGLLVNLNPEYEITNDAIAFVTELSESLIIRLAKEAARLVQYSQSPNKIITSTEIQAALRKILTTELARQAISEAATALSDFQAQQKEDTMKEAISEFEVLDGNEKKGTMQEQKQEKSGKHFIWFSPELILKFLSQQNSINVNTDKIDNTGTIFLSSSLEYFLTRLLDVVGRKSSPTLTKPAFQSVFEEGETFHGLWVNLHTKASAELLRESSGINLPASPLLIQSTIASPLMREPSSPSMPRRSSIPSMPGSPSVQNAEHLQPEPRLDVGTFVAPLLMLMGQACSGFEISSRGMQIVASLAEYLLRFIVVESSRVARYKPPHSVSTVQVQAAARRAIPSDLARDAITYASQNIETPFQGRELLLVHTTAGLVHPAWGVSFEEGADAYAANVLVYVIRHTLSVAASYARSAGRWVIRSSDVLQAAESVVTTAVPVWKAVIAAKDRSLETFLNSPLLFSYQTTSPPASSPEEGPVLPPPSLPRISAAEKIYFTSIVCETPLQTDNQLLIMFLLLASLSLRAIVA